MALIKYGGGVVGMSGSIAGSTFARNRYGNYVRARTKPVNPNTPAQQNIRSSIAFLTNYWKNILTSTQRAAWNLYASNVAMKNRMGETTYLTGFNHFIRSNSVLKYLGLAGVCDGPINFTLPEQDSTFAITASEATQTITVAFDATAAWAKEDGAYLLLAQGRPQNSTINFYVGPWLLDDSIAGKTETPPTSPYAYTANKVITEGQNVWMQARIIRADGRLSEPFRGSCTIAA